MFEIIVLLESPAMTHSLHTEGNTFVFILVWIPVYVYEAFHIKFLQQENYYCWSGTLFCTGLKCFHFCALAVIVLTVTVVVVAALIDVLSSIKYLFVYLYISEKLLFHLAECKECLVEFCWLMSWTLICQIPSWPEDKLSILSGWRLVGCDLPAAYRNYSFVSYTIMQTSRTWWNLNE